MKKRILALGMTLALVVGLAGTSLAASANGAAPGGDYPGSIKIAPSQYRTQASDIDNGIGNANESGKGVTTNDGSRVGDVIKSDNMVNTPGGSVGVQRTHGEYQNNTNSCASCHQTHTAASRQLLFKQGVFNTCTACHDGTLGFYNVFANNTATDKSLASTAGTFGGTAAGNASMHMPDNTFAISAAPGGKQNAGPTESWSGDFNCASCHAPHGAYSDRLLHFNPNDMGDTPVAEGGQKLVGLIITSSFADDVVVDHSISTAPAMDGNFVLYKTTASDPKVTMNVATPGSITPVYQTIEQKYGEAATQPVLVVMKKVVKSTAANGDKTWGYVYDSTPWLYGYDFSPDHSTKTYWTNLKLSDDKYNKDGGADAVGVGIKYQRGYYAPQGGEVAKFVSGKAANIARAYVVKLGGWVNKKVNGVSTDVNMSQIPVANANGFTVTKINSDVYDEATYGVAIGKYCAACHTDYLAATADQTDDIGVGVWSKAFRHTTNNDSYTCLKCHYAHGTDVLVMKDAQDKQVADLGGNQAAIDYMIDKNPSSALKRYTNMAVCWKCHTTSHSEQFLNDDKFRDSTNKPNTGSNW